MIKILTGQWPFVPDKVFNHHLVTISDDGNNLEETLHINLKLLPMLTIVLYLVLEFCSCDFFLNGAFIIISKENVSHKKYN